MRSAPSPLRTVAAPANRLDRIVYRRLHAAILLAAQPLIGHYLLPSAPLYMCAACRIIALAVPGQPASPRDPPCGVPHGLKDRRPASPPMPCSRRWCRRCRAHVIAAGHSSESTAKIIAARTSRVGGSRLRLSARMGPYPNSPAIHRGSCSIAAVVLLALPDADGVVLVCCSLQRHRSRCM